MQDQPTEPRKIIQTSVIQDTDNTICTLVALCNDGTVWTYAFDFRPWQQQPAIPQPEVSA
jgi:hypothetical protein